jgi:hypothetical protein
MMLLDRFASAAARAKAKAMAIIVMRDRADQAEAYLAKKLSDPERRRSRQVLRLALAEVRRLRT